MALASVGLPFSPIELITPLEGNAIGSLSTFQLNGSGDKIGFHFRTRAAITVDCVAVRTTVVTTGAANAVTVAIETLDLTNGRPDGTPIGATAQFTTVSATPNTYEVTGLGASLSANTDYFVTLTWAAGDCTFGVAHTANGVKPYYYTFDGTTHTKVAGLYLYCAIGTGTTAYLSDFPYFIGPATLTAESFSDAATDEIGCTFTPAGPMRLWGFVGSLGVAASVFNVKAYSSPTSSPVLLSNGGTDLNTTIDNDSTQATVRGRVALPFPTHFDLTAGVEYAITMRTGTAGTFSIGEYSYTDADFVKTIGGLWSLRKVARSNDSGNFTATNTIVPAIFPLLTHIDDGASGGGGGTRGYGSA